jgi:hypothetical protein
MRLLVLLLGLLVMPGFAVSALAQQSQQSSGTQRHPGDYCTKHCRHNEVPCGGGCLSANSGKKCTEKVTTTCGGKP